MKLKVFLFCLMSMLLPLSPIWSSTIIVDLNGTGDYTTIQGGIDNALDGDIVLVYPGTYYENIDYIGKNITVASKYYTTGNETYIDSTIIDGNYNGSCVTLNNGETDAEICGFTLQKGSGYDTGYQIFGGGIYIKEASFNVNSCYICDNIAEYGGGISVSDCLELNLMDTKIFNNHASILGGGISKGSYDVDINFSQQDRCDIYMNYSPMGSDIYNYGGDMTVFIDTFTVQEPDKFYVHSRNNSVTMNIQNHKIEPINQDVYVSSVGDNNNSGTSLNEAYQNIYHALIMVKSDSTLPNTIHIDEGFYSPSTTGEFFALGGKEYISIIGAGKELTILDAEQTDNLFSIVGVENFNIENLRLQHGYDFSLGGIYISKSNTIIEKVDLLDNNIPDELAVHILCYENSNPIFKDVTIKTTYDQVNGNAINTGNHCNSVFINCSIEGNKADPEFGHFGAMANSYESYPVLINCKIIDNYGDVASGIRQMIAPNDDLYLINCTVVDNDYCSQGTISLVDGGHVTLINTILRNEPVTEIWFHPSYDPNSATLEYCNIDGGSLAVAVNDNGTLNWGEGNIDEDPLFVGGDPFSYELTQYSPCIDAGTPDTTGLNLPTTDLAGNPRIFNGRIDIGAYECQDTVSINEPDTAFIHNLYLFQNTPNPFTNETEILFITADYERVGDYSLSIYNTKGQLIRRFDGNTHDFWVKTKISWDGTDGQGKQVAPGAYFYKLEYNGNAIVRKMVKLR